MGRGRWKERRGHGGGTVKIKRGRRVTDGKERKGEGMG